jgi:hypothetical protein
MTADTLRPKITLVIVVSDDRLWTVSMYGIFCTYIVYYKIIYIIIFEERPQGREERSRAAPGGRRAAYPTLPAAERSLTARPDALARLLALVHAPPP